jgi:integrase
MTRQQLTAKNLDALQPQEKPYSIHDAGVKGLQCRVHPGGSKSLDVVKKLDGKPVRVRICAVGELPLIVVRPKAAEIVAQIAQGINPNAAKRQLKTTQEATTYTLREALEEYVESVPLREQTVFNYRRSLKQKASALLDRPISQLTPAAIQQLHKDVAKTAPSSANVLVRVLRLLVRFSHRKFRDPMTGISPLPDWSADTMLRRWHPERRRKRSITPENMHAWHKAVEDMPNHMAGRAGIGADVLIFLSYTGLRIGETLKLTADMYDQRARVLHIPGIITKTGQAFDMPLSRQAAEIAERRAAAPGEKLFPIAQTQTYTRHVSAVTGIQFSPHDLRRTFLSYGAAAGINSYILKLLVNHAADSGDVTFGYVQADTETLRREVQKIADRIDMDANPLKQNVIPISKQGR